MATIIVNEKEKKIESKQVEKPVESQLAAPAPKRLLIRCRRCKVECSISETLELHANTSFDLPPGLCMVQSITYVEGDRIVLNATCANCYGHCPGCGRKPCSSCGVVD